MLTRVACPPILARGQYDALGRVSRKTFSSGQYEVFAYDTRDRLTSVILRNSGGSPQRTQVYGYDASSKVTSHAVNGATTRYTYDAAGQLLTEIRTGYSGSYTYDGNGNRLTRTVGGVTETYAYDDGDKLLSVSVGGSAIKTYGYDAAGRTTSVVSSAGTTTLAYDFEGRATSISGPGVSQSNVYNGLDTRVGSTTNSVVRTFLRDGAYVTDPVLTDGAATYTPGVSERRGSATTFLHSGLKNADSQSGTGQTVVASRQYDAFGNVASSTGTWSGPFGYAGGFGYQEDATGLKLLGHRYYDSSTGRFLTRDPIKDGRNWYAYCENDPIGGADPSGLTPQWVKTLGLLLAMLFGEEPQEPKVGPPPHGSRIERPSPGSKGGKGGGGGKGGAGGGRLLGIAMIFLNGLDALFQGVYEAVTHRKRVQMYVDELYADDSGTSDFVGGGESEGSGGPPKDIPGPIIPPRGQVTGPSGGGDVRKIDESGGRWF